MSEQLSNMQRLRQAVKDKDWGLACNLHDMILLNFTDSAEETFIGIGIMLENESHKAEIDAANELLQQMKDVLETPIEMLGTTWVEDDDRVEKWRKSAQAVLAKVNARS